MEKPKAIVFEPSGEHERQGMKLFVADFIEAEIKSCRKGIANYEENLRKKLNGFSVASAPGLTADDFRKRIRECQVHLELLRSNSTSMQASPKFIIKPARLIVLVAENGYELPLFSDLQTDLLERHTNNSFLQAMQKKSDQMASMYEDYLKGTENSIKKSNERDDKIIVTTQNDIV